MLLKAAKTAATLLAGILLSVGVMSTAQADIVITTTSTISGTGDPVSGQVEFKIVGSTLEVILTDTTLSILHPDQVLTGISFTLIGGTIGTLLDVIPNVDGSNTHPFEDCTSGHCTEVDAFQSHQTGNGACTETTEPFCWTFSGSSLSAGGGSYKPAGIVNDSVQPGAGNGGPGNAQHNDYLLGPVAFVFSFTGNLTDVADLLFYWGTGPDTTSGVCTNCALQENPEPASLALVGLALSGLAFARRRRKA